MGMTELTVPAEPDGPSHDLGSVRELTKTGADLLPIRVQIHRKNVGRCDNKIVTAKYSLLPFPEPSRWFLPLFIYELLFPNKRFANFFYLGVGMLQMVKSINPSGFPSTWGSLFFILLVNIFTLTKDDLARHKADEDQNRQPVSIITASESEPGVVVERQGAWADVAVGDVVRVRAKEAFPADMVLLRGSDPPGTCWVSTKALDGESDMKLRLAPQHGLTPGEEGGKGEMDARWSDESMAADDAGPMSPGSGGQPSVLKSMSDLDDSSVQPKGSAASLQQSFRWSGLSGELRCEEPNDKVNDFLGEMVLGSGLKLPLTPANMLLRGCVLHNTEWVYGLVVSTGTDTKINFGGGGLSIQKRSIVTKTLNLFVLLEVLLCFFMCLIGAACGQLSYGVGPGEPWYILDGAQPDETRYDPFFQVFMFYFLILYSMLPATLFVSADVINLCTAWYIKNDIDLYHAEEDEPCQVRQMSLCDELGQVSHIFSDKTGTLTSNHMEFRRILIDGTSYGVGETAISKSLREMGKAAAGRDYTKPGEVAPAVDVGEIELRGGPLPPWAGCRAETDTFVSFEEASASTSLFEAIVADSDAARRNREILINLAGTQSP